ncbi:PIN domain-containing protein [Oceaniradius stylonematis]|uniref:PIN domain-containing protein n=1 Tax=Oceaniradius stylonematis TaxID=2184161 RepID=UPI00273D2A7D|nr:PIN domain-containing protein [Oceaniradius stylonematis]
MSRYTALFDANILYPAPMRDLLMQLALTDLFKAKWTREIHEEWISALLENRSDLSREQLERTRDAMDSHVRDALIEGYDTITDSLTLPDADDRHVLAAAIIGRCDVIITQNEKDFPEDVVAPFGIEVQHPDAFLANLLALAPGVFCEAVRTVRARLNNPSYSAERYLTILASQGLVVTAAELEQFSALI